MTFNEEKLSMATREEIRQQVKQNLISLSKRELMNATKDAVKELLHESIAEFGWWSLKTIGTALLGATIMFIIYVEMGHKP